MKVLPSPRPMRECARDRRSSPPPPPSSSGSLRSWLSFRRLRGDAQGRVGIGFLREDQIAGFLDRRTARADTRASLPQGSPTPLQKRKPSLIGRRRNFLSPHRQSADSKMRLGSATLPPCTSRSARLNDAKEGDGNSTFRFVFPSGLGWEAQPRRSPPKCQGGSRPCARTTGISLLPPVDHDCFPRICFVHPRIPANAGIQRGPRKSFPVTHTSMRCAAASGGGNFLLPRR